MRRLAVVPLLGALLLPVTALAAGDKLSQSASITVGDLVAMQIESLLRIRSEFSDAPVAVTYDRSKKQLVVTIAGGREGVEGAKEALEKVKVLLVTEIAYSIKKSRSIDLVEDDFTLVYFNRRKNQELVRREGGKFVMP